MPNSFVYSHLYRWYESNRRVLPWRETQDAYCIWLSEVILQQTRVAQGLDYYMRFVARWPRVEDLASADEAEVLREWQGLGYYSRARNLHKAAQMIVANGWAPFPTRFEDIRSLPGIGDYTAGAISSFAYDLPYPAIDGNVYRVVARLLDIDEAFDTTSGKKLFHQHIETLLDREHPRLFNSAIMEFGALQCTPVLGDNCARCPLQSVCLGYAHGTAELLPVRKPIISIPMGQTRLSNGEKPKIYGIICMSFPARNIVNRLSPIFNLQFSILPTYSRIRNCTHAIFSIRYKKCRNYPAQLSFVGMILMIMPFLD